MRKYSTRDIHSQFDCGYLTKENNFENNKVYHSILHDDMRDHAIKYECFSKSITTDRKGLWLVFRNSSWLSDRTKKGNGIAVRVLLPTPEGMGFPHLVCQRLFFMKIIYVMSLTEDIRNMHQRIQFLYSKPQEKYDNFLDMQMA